MVELRRGHAEAQHHVGQLPLGLEHVLEGEESLGVKEGGSAGPGGKGSLGVKEGGSAGPGGEGVLRG